MNNPSREFSTFLECSQMPAVCYHSVIHGLGLFSWLNKHVTGYKTSPKRVHLVFILVAILRFFKVHFKTYKFSMIWHEVYYCLFTFNYKINKDRFNQWDTLFSNLLMSSPSRSTSRYKPCLSACWLAVDMINVEHKTILTIKTP